MFTISFDLSRNLVEMTLSGFMDEAEVLPLRERFVAILDTEGVRPGGFLAIVDITEFSIQSQGVMGVFAGMGLDPRFMPERLAFWPGTSLNSMQARKLAFPFPTQIFDSQTAALAWLFGDASKDAVAA
jgi:hypothetical protein